MATFRFTALRSLLLDHVSGELVTFSHELADALPPRRAHKVVVRSSSGRTETIFHRSETNWLLLFAPAQGRELEQLREFLDSTGSGETFLAWLDRREDAPLQLRRSDDGYTLAPFMRVGAADKDHFAATISAVTVT